MLWAGLLCCTTPEGTVILSPTEITLPGVVQVHSMLNHTWQPWLKLHFMLQITIPMSSFWKHENIKQTKAISLSFRGRLFKIIRKNISLWNLTFTLQTINDYFKKLFLRNHACWATWSQTSVNDFILLSNKAFNYGYFVKCVTLISHLLSRLLPRAPSSSSDSVAGPGSHYSKSKSSDVWKQNSMIFCQHEEDRYKHTEKNALLCKTLLHVSNTEGGQRRINCIGQLLRLKIEVYKAVPFFFFFLYHTSLL